MDQHVASFRTTLPNKASQIKFWKIFFKTHKALKMKSLSKEKQQNTTLLHTPLH